MEDLETEFESQFGYKPSFVSQKKFKNFTKITEKCGIFKADKQKHEALRILVADQLRLRKQVQACKESDGGIIEEVGSAGSRWNGSSTLSEVYQDDFLGKVLSNRGPRKTSHSLEAMTTMFDFLKQVCKILKTEAIIIR